MADDTYTYGIPVNTPVDGGSQTVLAVTIEGRTPRSRGKLLQKVLQQNYNLNRAEAIKCLRAMNFDNIII